jgi:hypothetical protein
LECCLARRAALGNRQITWFDFAVLDALDGHANKDGECWPPVATIAKKIGAALDKRGDCRAVRTSLKKSEALSLLRSKLKVRKTAGDYKTEKHYWLTVPARFRFTPVTAPDRLEEAVDTGLGKPANVPKEHTHEIETREEESLRDFDALARETRKCFIRFWAQWPNWASQPNKKYQEKAENIFATVFRDENDLAAIIEGVHRYIGHAENGQFMMNPARFLNEASWKHRPTPGKRPPPKQDEPASAAELEELPF